MIFGAQSERGARIAAAHVGLWRASPPPLAIDAATLDALAPIFLSNGSAPLLWPRIAGTPLAQAASAPPIQEAWRYQQLQSELRARELAQAIARLAEAGITPLLSRGWAAARLYPAPALRAYVDHDLAVNPSELDRARSALPVEWRVDLHAGFAELDDRGFQALARRAVAVELDGVPVRLLAPEDHLRQMCLHFTRHGGWRPLWLCDVACALEADGPRSKIDWQLFSSGNPRRTREAACVLALAHTLLGAQPTPLLVAPPRWLARTVLSEWGKRARYQEPFVGYLRRPLALPLALRDHFPNQVAASAELGAWFGDRPRARWQLLAACRRAANLLR
jgi:hypothetical protein